jgi:DNA-binding CsgD family transcriptional regulator
MAGVPLASAAYGVVYLGFFAEIAYSLVYGVRTQVPGVHGLTVAGAAAVLVAAVSFTGYVGLAPVMDLLVRLQGFAFDAIMLVVVLAVSSFLAWDYGSLKTRLAVEAAAAGADVDPGSPVALLTTREHQVLGEVSAGRLNKEIAYDLGISENTVAKHVSNILAKIGADNRTEAAAIAHGARL